MAKKKDSEGNEIPSGIPDSKYNARALRELILAGNSASEIMEKLSIRHKQTLRQHFLKLITDDKVLYEVKNLYEKSSSRPKVKKNGLICVSLKGATIDGREVVEGDEFIVNIESSFITLSRS